MTSVLFFMSSTPYCCQIVIKHEFSGQIFEKYSSTKFNGNPSSESGVVPSGRTNRHEETNSRFRNFAIAPIKDQKLSSVTS